MELTLGFSPCPNDTFIFDALVNHKIDTKGFTFNAALEDVETLNQWALQGKLDVTKLSFGVYFKVMEHYELLNAGSALGRGCGPLLISKGPLDMDKMADYKIAIPGLNTTANLLFSTAFPHAQNKELIIFSDIENAVLDGRVDAGVIIHESRFTYQQKGLHKLVDLGEYWEQTTGHAIPLGGIVVRKSLPVSVKAQIDALIRESLEYAFERYPALPPYVKEYAQEMDESVMRQHIDLYVNQFSIDLGVEGKKAVERLQQAV